MCSLPYLCSAPFYPCPVRLVVSASISILLPMVNSLVVSVGTSSLACRLVRPRSLMRWRTTGSATRLSVVMLETSRLLLPSSHLRVRSTSLPLALRSPLLLLSALRSERASTLAGSSSMLLMPSRSLATARKAVLPHPVSVRSSRIRSIPSSVRERSTAPPAAMKP